MVLGLRSKNRRPSSIQVDYTIHIQEIKPWPPSQSLKSVKSVVLQWENGDRSSGSTSPAAPSQSKIEFNESFNLHVALLRESSGKGNGLQKNLLELSLYEPRRDKTVKGQLLGNAVVDLADHGVLMEGVSFGVPLSCKRAYRNTAQPIVYIRIQPFAKESSSASASASSSFRESELKEEYVEEEVEIDSFTDDDDVSSHSSPGYLVSVSEANAGVRAQSSCTASEATAEATAHNSQGDGESTRHENESEAGNENYEATNLPFEPHLVKPELEPMRADPIANGTAINRDESLPESPPEDLCAENESLDNLYTSIPTIPEKPGMPIAENESLDNLNTSITTTPEKSDMPIADNEILDNVNTSIPTTPEKSDMPITENESLDNVNTSIPATPNKSDMLIAHTLPSELKPTSSEPIANVTATDRDDSSPQASQVDPCTDSESFNNGVTSFTTKPKRSGMLTTDSSSTAVASEVLQNHTLQPEIQEKLVNFRNDQNVVNEPPAADYYVHNNEMLSPEGTRGSRLSTTDEKSQEFRAAGSDLSAEEAKNFAEETIVMQMEDNVIEKMDEAVETRSLETESSPDSSPDNRSSASHESFEHTPVVRHKYLQNALRKPVNSKATLSSQRLGDRTLSSERLKNLRFSMRSPPHTSGGLRFATGDQEDVKEIDIVEDVSNGSVETFSHSRSKNRGNIHSSLDKVNSFSKGNVNNAPSEKVRELERRVEMLEGELREAAAIEISLYSIVAEHGSSMHKVHTPARRLSRLYIHATKHWSRQRKAHAAKSAVSGLALVAKACGNDVPRLTFWLSNAVVLRTIVTQAAGLSDLSNKTDAYSATSASILMAKGKPSPLKWESNHHNKEMFSSSAELDDWGELSTFTASLERVEFWIFSRIVESIWWQTFTPHMQSTNGDSEPRIGSHIKNTGRGAISGKKKTANFSAEIWKKAFSDACGRLCPVRSEGHECGCLPMLARSVMEQCIARLDVAMFNAILRESDDEIPTDPVSDPISDPKVLPIPPGKSSFGAGAHLKNAIGNWSRWLTDLFGMDADDSPQDKNEEDDHRLDVVETFKSFHLLNALSDLLMLPKDLLLEKSIRKEVCPTFSSSMISRILISFVSDEFCPDEIPDDVFEALESEDPPESNGDGISYYPYNASPILYSPPSLASVQRIIGDVQSTAILRRSSSSVLRKCHTSDDELDDLDSPLASIMTESSSSPATESKGNSRANVVRYQLLRDVWRCDD